MRTTRGAIIRTTPGEYEVADLLVDDPYPDEVQVGMVASGLCHSDDHHVTGDIPVGMYPMAMGHEGAGIVIAVGGPNSRGIEVGDHVVLAAMPSCGQCRWCASGRRQLCDMVGGIHGGSRWADGTPRLRLPDGTPVGQMCGISTFTELSTVGVDSVIKVPEDLPLDRACLIGCGVSTGWGTAVNSADVRPGQTVVVMGVGGVGINAVQGARHAGALHLIAVDPVAFKRDKALAFGATHAVATMEEATEIARGFTNGQGADSTIVTVGILEPEHVGQALGSIRKGGTVVLVSVGHAGEVAVPLDLYMLVSYEKRLRGALFGESNGTSDFLGLIELYREGVLELDDLVTTTYPLDDIAKAYQDMHDGRNLRGVITYPGTPV